MLTNWPNQVDASSPKKIFGYAVILIAFVTVLMIPFFVEPWAINRPLFSIHSCPSEGLWQIHVFWNAETPHGGLSVGFLEVTTCETKNSLLLIEVFSKLFNTKNYGHQSSILGGLFYFHLSVDIPDKIGKILTTEHSSSLLPPKSKTHRTRCPTVNLLDCGAFFIEMQG